MILYGVRTARSPPEPCPHLHLRPRVAAAQRLLTATLPTPWVLPQLGELRLNERDTAHLDAPFSRLERAHKLVELPDGTTSRSRSTRPTPIDARGQCAESGPDDRPVRLVSRVINLPFWSTLMFEFDTC
jgi:hypothetical protein